jgi:hypothetical protein
LRKRAVPRQKLAAVHEQRVTRVRIDGDRINRAVVDTEITEHAVLRVFEIGLLGFLVHPDDIDRTCGNALSTADTGIQIYIFNGHFLVLFYQRFKRAFSLAQNYFEGSSFRKRYG